MLKNIVYVRLNNSNLTLCISKKLVDDWNENTWYNGKNFYIKKNISRRTRYHVNVVDRMLKMERDKMGQNYWIDPKATTPKLELV